MNIQSIASRLRFREAVGIEIDRLISLLDAIDGDPDIEETGDEHDTGAPEGWKTCAHWQASSQDMILEDDEEGAVGEDDGIDEPSLGSTELKDWHSQANWALGSRSDREEENEHGGDIQDEPHDDAGNFGGIDHEPDLGWTNHVNQTLALKVIAGNHDQDSEPDYGFVGIGTGWRYGEETDDREGCSELDDDKSDYEYDLGWSNPRFGDEAFVTPTGWAHTDVPCTGEGGGMYRPEPLVKKPSAAYSALADVEGLIPEIEPGSLFLRTSRR